MLRLGKRASKQRPTTGGRLVSAIGDIHGRYDLLKRLMLAIEDDLASAKPSEPPLLVFLRDDIDCGPNSLKVVRTICSIRQRLAIDAQFLRGHHEQAMLDFLYLDTGAYLTGALTACGLGREQSAIQPRVPVSRPKRANFETWRIPAENHDA